ncbi:MAG: DNA-binding protein [Isosphaera sp.]|nr:DNA-binding protein [Isosphaera sp.]
MKPRVYVETTVPSYLTGRPSRDLLRAAHQQATRDWWAEQRPNFDLVVSQFVLDECAAGDPAAAAERLVALADIPVVATPDAAVELAEDLAARVPLPPRARTDALHIAVATLHRVEYLLTWNLTHLANAVLRARVEQRCRDLGHTPPQICTPLELKYEGGDEGR